MRVAGNIVDRIRPVVRGLQITDPLIRQRELSQRAIGENVRFVVNQLADDAEILRKRVQSRKLLIVGAEYSLESGNVTFFS